MIILMSIQLVCGKKMNINYNYLFKVCEIIFTKI